MFSILKIFQYLNFKLMVLSLIKLLKISHFVLEQIYFSKMNSVTNRNYNI